tara:strand:+ start:19019 stop:19636 length:618 start_codon:yes stop_codon:yes gene_type:complete
MRKIKLYGELAKKVGHKEFEVEVHNISRAVSFLINNFPELERFMSPKYYQVKIGDYSIDKDEIDYPLGRQDIHFIPVIEGQGGNFGKILLGGALIAMSFGVGGAFGAKALTFGKGFGASFATASFGAKAAFGIGAGLLLTGVTDMLFPLPEPQKFSSEEDPQLSFSFSGVQNTSRAGTPVPLVYGEIFTGSVVISAAVDTNQVEA